MNRRIKFRHLEAFVAIARAKSLKRAAEQLNLSQPAISKTLRELEDILRASLMDRGRGGIRLTPQGDVFLQFAEQSISALESGLSGLATMGEGGSSALRIGALPSVMSRLMPRASAHFRRASPGTVLHIFEGPHDHLTDRLRQGTLDLVIGRLGSPESMQGLSFTQLYSEQVVIVVAPGHPLAGATRLEQLRNARVIYPPRGSAIRPLVARQMIASGMPLFANRIECAAAAFGRAMTLGPEAPVWFISRGVVEDDIASGVLIPLEIDLGATEGPIGIMARAEEAGGALLHLFRASLQSAVPGGNGHV